MKFLFKIAVMNLSDAAKVDELCTKNNLKYDLEIFDLTSTSKPIPKISVPDFPKIEVKKPKPKFPSKTEEKGVMALIDYMGANKNCSQERMVIAISNQSNIPRHIIREILIKYEKDFWTFTRGIGGSKLFRLL
jgi:hypothetical protein